MQKTPYFDLNKPESNDFYNIEDFNENANKIDSALHILDNGKQEKLIFDDTPTENSNNPVSSGGIFEKYNKSIIVKTNVTVDASLWESDTTFPDYSLKATVNIAGVTADHVPDVTFDPADVLTGLFAPVAQSGAGTVTIYANDVPEGNTTLLSVVCRKEI